MTIATSEQRLPMSFPSGFIWGAATAAYQIEGAVKEDGRGESIWDRFSHTPGRVKNDDNGDVACDSYHRYCEDIALLKQLNLRSYRYSIAWPRIQSDGTGPANQRGLDYYLRLTDAVLEAGLRPSVTLYHWDLPQALQDKGGWASRDIAHYFSDYVAVVAKALGDRVQHFTIFNEPKTFTGIGHWEGRHAPGTTDPLNFLRVTHVVNLAQGMAFRVLKSFNPRCEVGSAFDVAPMIPASNDEADRAAAERWHKFQNLWFVQTALRGEYPSGVLPAERRDELLGIKPGDEQLVRAPLDFIGINYYSPWVVCDAPQGNGIPGLNTQAQWARMTGQHPRTDLGWDIYPQGFHDILLVMAKETEGRPIDITENGAAFNTGPDEHDRIYDTARIRYLRQHLLAVANAIQDGVNVRSFHHWSLLDNFEWAEGYSQRFGLVYVDFANGQRRLIKESGHWFAQVAATNTIT